MNNLRPLAPVRRVITANNDAGRSFISGDGPSPAQMTLAQRPGYCNANLWRTGANPSATECPDDIASHRGVMPPAGGTVLRVIDFPPQPKDPEEARRQSQAAFAELYADARHQPSSTRHPGMHATSSVDYAIVVHGSITAIMDEDETVLHAGDVLVQRGTAHAWANHTDQITRVAFVLIDAPA